MTQPRSYNSPEAFKQALESRLRVAPNLQRARQLLVMERFYGRLSLLFGADVIVKGGMVLERRLERARTTKDLDLHLKGDPEALLSLLQEAGRLPLGDFMSFGVVPDPDRATIDGEGLVYEGRRFRVTPFLAGKVYGATFGVDAGFGDPVWGEVEILEGSDILDFSGAPRPFWRVYPRQTHLAEKLHAYTMPRSRENTRIRDLPDIALLATTGTYDGADLRRAIETTFSFRSTHDLPFSLPHPPASWALPYARMAELDQLPWRTLDDLIVAVQAFLEPVLAAEAAVWLPGEWRWDES